ncbi:MAG TPA: hypothetical protein VD789_07515 [Thermomicrobiales bacterium]|nr:hypothetical protein [Thermomicrobiales bacterium]
MDVSLTERNVVLVAHVLAAILFLGPVTVATSLFPRYARLGQWQVARAFHRISRGYGMATLAVPAFGLVLAARLGYLGQLWINLSLALFVAGFFLMVGYIVPAQGRILASESPQGADPSGIAKLRVATGSFGIIWLVVLYLMVAKPS